MNQKDVESNRNYASVFIDILDYSRNSRSLHYAPEKDVKHHADAQIVARLLKSED